MAETFFYKNRRYYRRSNQIRVTVYQYCSNAPREIAIRKLGTMRIEEFNEQYVGCNVCGHAHRRADCEEFMLSNNTKYFVAQDELDLVDKHFNKHTCTHCGREFIIKKSFIPKSVVNPDTGELETLCNECHDDLPQCDCCGKKQYWDASFLTSVWGDRRCHKCDTDTATPTVTLQGYHTMKNAGKYRFLGEEGETRANTPFMGFELEVDAINHSYFSSNEKNAIIQSAARHLGSFINYERDGSLNNGFEMISQPATTQFIFERRKYFTQAFNSLIRNGMFSHNAKTCGLHIHIDRKYFGDENEEGAIAKLLYIFERFWDELFDFSRRETTRWCGRYANDSPKTIANKAKNKAYTAFGRYYAVNLTNINTIEIRLWRGTLNINTFLATILFTDRLARLAKEKTAEELQAMEFDDILGDNPIIRGYWEQHHENTDHQI